MVVATTSRATSTPCHKLVWSTGGGRRVPFGDPVSRSEHWYTRRGYKGTPRSPITQHTQERISQELYTTGHLQTKQLTRQTRNPKQRRKIHTKSRTPATADADHRWSRVCYHAHPALNPAPLFTCRVGGRPPKIPPHRRQRGVPPARPPPLRPAPLLPLNK